MSESKDKQLFKLITSYHFTPDLFLHYLIRKHDNPDVMDNLIIRLYNFDDQQISSILYYVIYFDLMFPNQLVERFLCDMCARSAHLYFKIYSLTEAFAFELGESDPHVRDRIDRLLEAFECSMVNEDNRYTGSLKKKSFKDQFEMMEHSINKRIKNDFKDDVKHFFHLMIQPCHSLKNLQTIERSIFLKGYFEGTNRWFYQRRKAEEFPTVKGMKLMHGFTMPFDNFPESNTIVRVAKDEFIVFETKERCPYMCVFETIE